MTDDVSRTEQTGQKQSLRPVKCHCLTVKQTLSCSLLLLHKTKAKDSRPLEDCPFLLKEKKKTAGKGSCR